MCVLIITILLVLRLSEKDFYWIGHKSFRIYFLFLQSRAPHSYLVDRAYKIDSSLLLFNNDVQNLTHVFKRNQYLEKPINKVVKAYRENYVNSAPSDKSDTFYFKLPYPPFSNFA